MIKTRNERWKTTRIIIALPLNINRGGLIRELGGAELNAINSGSSTPFSTLYTGPLSDLISFTRNTYTYTVNKTFMIQYHIQDVSSRSGSENTYRIHQLHMIIPKGTYLYYGIVSGSEVYMYPGQGSLTTYGYAMGSISNIHYFFYIYSDGKVYYRKEASGSESTLTQKTSPTSSKSFLGTGYSLYV